MAKGGRSCATGLCRRGWARRRGFAWAHETADVGRCLMRHLTPVSLALVSLFRLRVGVDHWQEAQKFCTGSSWS
eukprot:845385-Amphidinium_carterae.2